MGTRLPHNATSVDMTDPKDRPLVIDEETLIPRVCAMGMEIRKDLAAREDANAPFVVMHMLEGARLFADTLAGLAGVECAGTGTIRITPKDFCGECAAGPRLDSLIVPTSGLLGLDVLLVTYAVKTGGCLRLARQVIQMCAPRRLRIAVLVRKGKVPRVPLIDYLGFEIPDIWVEGFGLSLISEADEAPQLVEVPIDQLIASL